MPSKAKQFLLDTSALLSLKANEPGAVEVEKILRHEGLSGHVYVCFITLMEFYYIIYQLYGEAEAKQSYLELKQLPIQVVASDEALGLAAGRFKATFQLSLADAWIAATAEKLDAILVHKDPEFEALQDIIKLQHLPYKN